MTDFKKIIEKYEELLQKAIKHFEYSYQIVKSHPTRPDALHEKLLADFESFSSRFSRVVDIYLTKYLRAQVLKDDPGFSGTLRDFLNQAEKMRLIDDTAHWLSLRELRNIEAHTYEEELEDFLKDLLLHAPTILSIKQALKA